MSSSLLGMAFYIIARGPVRKGLLILRLPADNATLDDFELMRRIAGGDQAALAQCYDKFSPWSIPSACRSLRRIHQETEDLLIDVFYEIWDRGEAL